LWYNGGMKDDERPKYKIECPYPYCRKHFVVSDPNTKIPEHPFPGEWVEDDGYYLRRWRGSGQLGNYIGLV